MNQIVSGIKQQNKSLLMVTHYLEYLHLADKLLYVENGGIRLTGSLATLEKSRFFEEFKKDISVLFWFI